MHIYDKIINQDKFSFKPISKLHIEKEVQFIDPKKESTSDSIPPKILRISLEASAEALQNLFNMLKTGHFPDNLELTDIIPVFKWKNPLHKVSYRPVNVLPSILKVFEKLVQKQISVYISNYLSHYCCGYRKDFTSQQALLSLIENYKKILHKKGFGGAVLIDLSKTFNTIKHDLLNLIFMHMVSTQNHLLKLLHSYLRNGWHRTKKNKQFTSWQELIQRAQQGSVLGPPLFDIYLNDLFYLVESSNVCSFADDATFYACDKDLNSLINRLEHDS